jgi:tetratricopeptide (TPR) repeat protein
MTEATNTGKQLEIDVAQAYRQMGAWKVEHNVEIGGNQIDVYAELETPGRLLHRIAVEVKDWNSPVGIDIVNRFGHIAKLLHSQRLIDEGLIVSASGFSRPARRAAQTHGIRLVEFADLEALVAKAEADGQTKPLIRSVTPPLVLPPSPYFAHPYPLQENFTGRIHERQMLSEWFLGDGRSIVSLVALGGMGKSALAWVWLLQDVLHLPLPGLADAPSDAVESCRVPEAQRPEGALWWSFYDPEASFGTFLDKALMYSSDGSLDPGDLSSNHEKVRALIGLLQDRRLLIVLDGFERELRAYASLSSAYQGDRVAEDLRGDYRACTDIHAGKFLRWAAALALQSRVLLTSRLHPLELDGLAGSRREELTALDPEDAVRFFHVQGIKGTRREIQAACEPCGYHPLTLRLLSGMIANDPIRPGDIAAVADYNLIEDLVPRELNILALAYDALSPSLQELLSRLSAFRSPVQYEVAAMLSPFRNRRDLGLAFSELADRGLIYFDEKRWRYDLHPIVRAYAYNRLADKEGIHGQLRDYFASAPMPDPEQITRIEDLGPLIELYHHTVCAGQYDHAVELFHDNLADPLYYRFGAYRTEIDLLIALFAEDPRLSAFQTAAQAPTEERLALPRLKEPSARAWTLNALANSYTCSGQPRRAVPLLKVHNTLQQELDDATSMAVGLQNLASVHFELGELQDAERNLRRSIDWARKHGELAVEASGRTDFGRVLTYLGAFDTAGRELDAALEIQIRLDQTQSQVLTWIHRAQRALFVGIPREVLDAAASALNLAEQTAISSQSAYQARGLVWVHWLLGAAHLELQELADAEAHLNKALKRCRHINLVELEPNILLSWARWHHLHRDREQALECAEEALSIATRSEYRLKEAEVHNFLGHLALDAGEGAKAANHAEMAKERAWCDGPPYCYQPALDEADGLLELISS